MTSPNPSAPLTSAASSVSSQNSEASSSDPASSEPPSIKASRGSFDQDAEHALERDHHDASSQESAALAQSGQHAWQTPTATCASRPKLQALDGGLLSRDNSAAAMAPQPATAVSVDDMSDADAELATRLLDDVDPLDDAAPLDDADPVAALAEELEANSLERDAREPLPLPQASATETLNAPVAAKGGEHETTNHEQSRKTNVDQEPNAPSEHPAASASPLTDAKLPGAGARAWAVLATTSHHLGELLARLPRPELRWHRAEASTPAASPAEDAEPDVKAAAVADAAELLLLDNIRALRTARVEDVRVPRADIAFISNGMSLEEIVAKARAAGHSRFPVIGDSQDEVLGMIHIKDLLWGDVDSEAFRVQDFMREVLFVAPSMPVLQLLQDMQLKRHHMALIVDEFGGIDGLVTIEDLVEEIVGDISDEYDADREPALLPQADGTWIIDARYRIDELEERIGEFLTEDEREEDLDTLGGLVTHIAGRVPTRNELIEHDSGMRFLVVEADPRRIKRLRMRAKSLAAAKGLVGQASKTSA